MRNQAHAASWKEKLPGALVALVVQAGFFALLVFSFTVVTRAPEKEAEVIFLLPRLKPPPSDPMVIDARPKRPPADAAAPPVASSLLPPGEGAGITAAPPSAAPPVTPAPSDKALLQSLGRAAGCNPGGQGRVSPLCPPAIARPDPNGFVLNPPNGVQNEERWAAEKKRADSPFDLGVAVGPGIGIVIQDPLCKLVGLFMRNLHCGAPPLSTAPATPEQLKAALDAVNARKRAIYGKPVLASPQQGGGEHEIKDSPGDSGASAGDPAR